MSNFLIATRSESLLHSTAWGPRASAYKTPDLHTNPPADVESQFRRNIPPCERAEESGQILLV